MIVENIEKKYYYNIEDKNHTLVSQADPLYIQSTLETNADNQLDVCTEGGDLFSDTILSMVVGVIDYTHFPPVNQIQDSCGQSGCIV